MRYAKHCISMAVLVTTLGTVGCGDGDDEGSAEVVQVTISPASATLAAGSTRAFSATVVGSSDTTVIWSVQEATGCGSVSTSGMYTAPDVSATCHLVARSAADANAVAVATVTVTVTSTASIIIAIAPEATTIVAGEHRQFAASVTGSSETGATWAVQEASGCGSVTPTGYYTAPDAAGTCHVVARSVADATKSAVATITVKANPFTECQVCHSTPPIAPHLQTAVAFCSGCHDTLNADGTVNRASGLHMNATTDAHDFAHPSGWSTAHADAANADLESCKGCHGTNLSINCNTCHAVVP